MTANLHVISLGLAVEFCLILVFLGVASVVFSFS